MTPNFQGTEEATTRKTLCLEIQYVHHYAMTRHLKEEERELEAAQRKATNEKSSKTNKKMSLRDRMRKKARLINKS